MRLICVAPGVQSLPRGDHPDAGATDEQQEGVERPEGGA